MIGWCRKRPACSMPAISNIASVYCLALPLHPSHVTPERGCQGNKSLVLAPSCSSRSSTWEASARGGKWRGGGGGLGRRSPASEGPYAGRNLAGDKMAGGSSVDGGVQRCRGDEVHLNAFGLTRGVIVVVLDWSDSGRTWRIGAAKAGGSAAS